MVRKIMLVLVSLSMFAVFSCKTPMPEAQPLCGILFATVTGAAQGVAAALACENVNAIAADLSIPIAKANICPAQGEAVKPQGVIAELVCPQVSSFVVSFGVASLPPAWKCKGGLAADKIGELGTTQCKKSLAI